MSNPSGPTPWFQGEEHASVVALLPSAWRGEVDCVVGPFSSRQLAQNFVNFQVDFDPETAVVDDIFARGDAWYVELRTLRWS